MKAEPYHYDLVIMDIRMPNMSGIQLYYRLKAVDPYNDVLLVTALDVVKEWVDSTPGLKIDHIINKPISRDKFIEKVKSILSNK
jgi:response regulator RpfG family c-di-GMP phosphodiesterase